tara:strand:- start:700 stop:873 length:174 start_codon:yes stop_codon:yes gene_type:complete
MTEQKRHREKTAGRRNDPNGKAVIQRLATPTVGIQALKVKGFSEKGTGFSPRYTPSE